MSAVLVDVASAILTDLNADPITNFGYDFTAVRSYAEWDENLEEFGTLHVDVVPAADESTHADRSGNVTFSPTTQIVVRQRFRRDETTQRFDLDDIDGLVGALEKIHDFFVQHQLSTLTNATWISSKIAAPYVKSLLKTNHQYTGIVEVKFEVVG